MIWMISIASERVSIRSKRDLLIVCKTLSITSGVINFLIYLKINQINSRNKKMIFKPTISIRVTHLILSMFINRNLCLNTVRIKAHSL